MLLARARVAPALLAALGAALTVAPRDAAAIRPFDGTDAAVADPGTIELELSPATWRRLGDDDLLSQLAVVNLGIAQDWEVSASGVLSFPLHDEPDEPSVAFDGADLVLKRILREGQLQDATGPSVAVELAALLPTSRPGDGAGVSVTGVTSVEAARSRFHFSVGGGYGRLHEPAFTASLCAEGPAWYHAWPVAELRYARERHVGGVESVLVGAVFAPRADLSFDVSGVLGRIDGETFRELRVGLTWRVRAWGEPSAEHPPSGAP